MASVIHVMYLYSFIKILDIFKDCEIETVNEIN